MRRRNAMSPASLEACQLQVFAAQHSDTEESSREDSNARVDDNSKCERRAKVSRRNAMSLVSLEASQLQLFAARYYDTDSDYENSSKADSP